MEFDRIYKYNFENTSSAMNMSLQQPKDDGDMISIEPNRLKYLYQPIEVISIDFIMFFILSNPILCELFSSFHGKSLESSIFICFLHNFRNSNRNNILALETYLPM